MRAKVCLNGTHRSTLAPLWPSGPCPIRTAMERTKTSRETRPWAAKNLKQQDRNILKTILGFLYNLSICTEYLTTNALKIIAYWQSINSNKWDRPHTCYEIKYQDFNLEGVSKKQNTTLIEIDFPWFSLWGCLFYDSLFFIFLFSVQQVVSTGDGLNQSSVGVQRTGPQLGG